jgi:signal transduction histidine kinase
MGNSIADQNGRKLSFSAAQQDEDRGFSHVLRHELNNPLTGILGNAELLLAEVKRKNLELPAAAVRRLEIIVALAVRMRETVRRLGDEWSAREEEVLRELQSHAS